MKQKSCRSFINRIDNSDIEIMPNDNQLLLESNEHVISDSNEGYISLSSFEEKAKI